ncbi:hypothetical protein D3C85_1606420 [compost metagenome]
MLIQLDLRIDGQRSCDFRNVQCCGISQDVAAFFKSLDSDIAWARREVDLFRKGGVGQRAILLQLCKNGNIYAVEPGLIVHLPLPLLCEATLNI